MMKKLSIFIIFYIFFLITTTTVSATHLGAGADCDPNNEHCASSLSCQLQPSGNSICVLGNIGVAERCDIRDDRCTPGTFCQRSTVSGENRCFNPLPAGSDCVKGVSRCVSGTSCQTQPSGNNICAPGSAGSGLDVFGKIVAPNPIQSFGTGSEGISSFLSKLIVLIYMIAFVVFTFMIIWGAFEWLTSGGDKERIAAARGRLINAFIGIVLFAIAFAILRVVGQFTGFKFFS